MKNTLFEVPKEPHLLDSFLKSKKGNIYNLLNSKDLSINDMKTRDKIQLIGVALYPVIKGYDFSYITLIIKLAIEHLSTSEMFTACLNDNRGGDDSQIIEILSKIRDGFIACDILICEDEKEAKSKILDHILE